MKKIILIMFLISALSIVTANAQTISCPNCHINDCQCSITNCQNGTLRIYNKTICSGLWAESPSFVNGNIIWHPNKIGDYSMIVDCDDGNISSCFNVSVISAPTTTTTTTIATIMQTTSGGGEIGGGGGGGGGAKCSMEGHVCTQRTPCCSGLSCISDICRKVSTTTTSTTITIQTTPTASSTMTSSVTTSTTESGAGAGGKGYTVYWYMIIVLALILFAYLAFYKKMKQKKLSSRQKKASSRQKKLSSK